MDAGIRLPGDDRFARDVLEEVDHARYPPVHEGLTPSYGAVIVPRPVRPETLGGTVLEADAGGPEVIRRLADGRQSFVVRRRRHFDLLLFDIAHDREAELIRLRAKAPSSVIVQRTASGGVRILAPDGLFVWDGAHWWAKPYASVYAEAVLEAVPDAPRKVLDAILDFCVHTMSPAKGGAVLVWRYCAGGDGMFEGCNPAVPPVRVPLLSLTDSAIHAAARHLLTQVDGAAIVTDAGALMAIGAHLRASQRSHELVALDPTRGTRHASARRFSYDHDDSVVFVVSSDGPVTVYSDGAAVASIEQRADEPIPTDPRPDGTRTEARELRCPRCLKRTSITGNGPASRVEAGVRCPVCAVALTDAGNGTAHVLKEHSTADDPSP